MIVDSICHIFTAYHCDWGLLSVSGTFIYLASFFRQSKHSPRSLGRRRPSKPSATYARSYFLVLASGDFRLSPYVRLSPHFSSTPLNMFSCCLKGLFSALDISCSMLCVRRFGPQTELIATPCAHSDNKSATAISL